MIAKQTDPEFPCFYKRHYLDVLPEDGGWYGIALEEGRLEFGRVEHRTEIYVLRHTAFLKIKALVDKLESKEENGLIEWLRV